MVRLPQAELAASQAPFVDLLGRLLGEGSGRFLALFVVISGLGALNGILFKNATALEQASKIGAVVFDKTGTLTVGEPRVVEVVGTGGLAEAGAGAAGGLGRAVERAPARRGGRRPRT